MAQPMLGLIVPPREPFLHPDTRCFPQARFLVEGLGVREMAVEDFDAAPERVLEAARALGRRGAHAIALLGTSLSFYRGPAHNKALQEAMARAGGCPAVTASSAVVEALRASGAKRLAVGTAYDEPMNDRLRDYLAESGFEVSGMVGMNLRKVADAMAVADEAIMRLAEAALEAAGRAEAVLISCGAFATGHLIPALQKRYGRPVVSTTPATIAAALSAIAP